MLSEGFMIVFNFMFSLVLSGALSPNFCRNSDLHISQVMSIIVLTKTMEDLKMHYFSRISFTNCTPIQTVPPRLVHSLFNRKLGRVQISVALGMYWPMQCILDWSAVWKERRRKRGIFSLL